ncbi:MAP1D [Symbiodinium necroappetens]|uniref:MAP1D protein n=1 Tax=Symbiodinium necroappetens TaxID=1628268 RepID=A0A812NZN1_9DINO|nr:MAP1D [Symbiodinium necroappetens]
MEQLLERRRRPSAPLRLCLLGFLSVAKGNEFFDCDTPTCARHSSWLPAPYPNSTDICQELQIKALQSFVSVAPQLCREWAANGLGVWEDCRKSYCQALGDLASNLSHAGTNLYYGGDECRPLVNFNQTLCETVYRDAEGFCECFCPSFGLLQVPSVGGCESKIYEFLFLGRRGVELSQKYALSGYCAGFLCEFMNKLGEPDPPYPIEGLPGKCKSLELPWRVEGCVNLVSEQPYNPEAWKTPYPEDNVMECVDKTTHEVDVRHADTMQVCNTHKFRWRCPNNVPVMCKDPYYCTGDHCCVQTVDECPSGEREASPMLALELPEWIGRLPPNMIERLRTTTSLDAYNQFLGSLGTTSRAPSFAQQISDYAWAGSAILVVIGLTCSCLACYYMGLVNTSHIRKVVLGPARLLNAYHADPVTFFASGNLPRNKKREAPLPPMRPAHEIEEERRDNEACAALEDAWDIVSLKGMRHLVGRANDPDPFQAKLLRDAISIARSRGLQVRAGVADVLQKGEKWLSTLEAERELLRAVEEARPDLRWAAQVRLTEAPVVGKPWIATTMFKMAESEVRSGGWKHIEDLRAAVQVAESRDISESHMKEAQALLAALVARTHELPSDRCVLDPDGEGIKLLPKGHQRAVWPITGDTYTYEQGSSQGGDMGVDILPPKEVLGDAAVDDARPVCAEWAKSSRCKAGRDCPWRHCRPQAGDSVRECILFDM